MCAWPIAATSCVVRPVPPLVAARRESRAPPPCRAPTMSAKSESRPRRSPASVGSDASCASSARSASKSNASFHASASKSAELALGQLDRRTPACRRGRCTRARPGTRARPAPHRRRAPRRRGACSGRRSTRPSTHSVGLAVRLPQEVDALAAPLLGHGRRARGTSTSPRAARTARRARRAGTRAPAPRPRRSGRRAARRAARRPAASVHGSAREAAPTSARSRRRV